MTIHPEQANETIKDEHRVPATPECRCYCHRQSGAGKPGSVLFDGCDRCGCEAG